MRSQEDWEICPRALVRQKFDRSEIVRNRTNTTIRRNDEDGKLSHAKLSTGEHSGGPGYFNMRARAKYLTVIESHKIAWVPQLGRMKKIGYDPA